MFVVRLMPRCQKQMLTSFLPASSPSSTSSPQRPSIQTSQSRCISFNMSDIERFLTTSSLCLYNMQYPNRGSIPVTTSLRFSSKYSSLPLKCQSLLQNRLSHATACLSSPRHYIFCRFDDQSTICAESHITTTLTELPLTLSLLTTSVSLVM